MGCPREDDSDELIVAYVASTLAQEQRTELERHLRSCVRCRELAEAQRVVWSALDAWPPSSVGSNFDEKLFRRIAMEERRVRWGRLWPGNLPWRPAVPVAVACGALIAAFLLKSPTVHMEPQSQPNPKIEQVEHALDDMDMLKQLKRGECSRQGKSLGEDLGGLGCA
jgi:anti-sigma factor RsiW